MFTFIEVVLILVCFEDDVQRVATARAGTSVRHEFFMVILIEVVWLRHKVVRARLQKRQTSHTNCFAD